MERQHPIIIVTAFLDELKSLALPIILSFIVQVGSRESFGLSRGYVIFMSVLLGFMLLYGFLRWLFFKYDYDEAALVIKQGIFIKKNRTIKKERIQSFNTEAGILLRLFNLVTLNIETAANTQEPEFNLKALKIKKAESIMKTLKKDKKDVDTEEQPLNTIKTTLSTKQLFLAGITSGSVGIIFGFLSVVASQGFVFLPDQAIDWIINSIVASSIVGIITIGSLVFMLAWLISIIRYVIRFAFFTIEKEDDTLFITRGLIVKKTFSIKLNRIQALIIDEGLLRQPFKLATIQAEVAGGSKYEESFRISLMPIIHKTWIDDFIKQYISDYNLEISHKVLPKRALRRYLIRSNAVLLLMVPLLYISMYFLWGILFIIPLTILGFYRYKDGAYTINEKYFILRSRIISKRTFYALKPHVQSFELTKTIFQRYRKLFTTNINVLSAAGKSTFTLKDIDEEEFLTFLTWFNR